MLDESPLDVPPSIEIQMQIDGGGLDIVMAQMVLDVCYRFPLVEKIHSPGVTKAVNRTDGFEPFRG